MYILSYEFAVLFLAFFCIYWLCRRSIKLQNLLLLVASICYLATWNLWFVFSLLITWQASQISVLAMHNSKSPFAKNIALICGLLFLVGQLCFFKYSNFFIDEVNSNFANANFNPLDIIVPLGLSFYTFQAISYIVDVYKHKTAPMQSLTALAFLSFVPTITSGPIFRAKDAIAQWQGKPSEPVNDTSLTSNSRQTPSELYKQQPQQTEQVQRQVLLPYLAATLICVAVFKKLVLAGWLSEIWVNPIFANPLQFHGLEVLMGIYAYAFQLFFDFSGYTDLAIAIGLLLGFKLPQNFNKPYLATNIREFWNRWHITLSTWIRDYLYIPLGGNRGSFWRVQFNLIIAFVLSGIWHGAGWNFFIWGLIHAFAMVWLNILKKQGFTDVISKRSKILSIAITFNYVCFGWIFFHSQTLDNALLLIQSLFNFQDRLITLPLLLTTLIMVVFWLLYARITDFNSYFIKILKCLPWWLLPVFLSIYMMLVLSIAPEGLPSFIYANF